MNKFFVAAALILSACAPMANVPDLAADGTLDYGAMQLKADRIVRTGPGCPVLEQAQAGGKAPACVTFEQNRMVSVAGRTVDAAFFRIRVRGLGSDYWVPASMLMVRPRS
jgi:hypothetical protein